MPQRLPLQYQQRSFPLLSLGSPLASIVGYWYLLLSAYEPRPSNNKCLNMFPQYSRMLVIGRNTTGTWKHMCVKTCHTNQDHLTTST